MILWCIHWRNLCRKSNPSLLLQKKTDPSSNVCGAGPGLVPFVIHFPHILTILRMCPSIQTTKVAISKPKLHMRVEMVVNDVE